MKNYNQIIHNNWHNDKYKHIANKDSTDNFFKEKFHRIGITNRKGFLILRDIEPNVIDKYINIHKELYTALRSKGISCINGNLLRPCGKTGPTEIKGKKRKKSPSDFIDDREFALEDIACVNYDEVFSSDLDKNKQFREKIYKIKFGRDIYNHMKKEMYDRYEEIYNHDKKNGNLDMIANCMLKLSCYAEKKELKREKNFIDGGVICNIAIIISEYIKTGKLDTDIKRFDRYSINELNEEYNTYMMFLLLNMFTCKQKKYKMTFNEEIVRDKWYVNFIRRRLTDKIMRSTCVLPIFKKDEYGNITLYNDK